MTTPFRRILIANDGSNGAFKALACAIELACTGAGLHMVSVEELPEFPEIIEEVRAEKVVADVRYRRVTHRARAMGEDRGVEVRMHLMTGHPVRSIIDLASQPGVDLLVIGATGLSTFFARMLDTRAGRIAEMASCSVLIVK